MYMESKGVYLEKFYFVDESVICSNGNTTYEPGQIVYYEMEPWLDDCVYLWEQWTRQRIISYDLLEGNYVITRCIPIE